MRRREFIAGIGSTAAWPVLARAQQQSMPVVGFLDASSSAPSASLVEAFRRGLREAGYVEGQNIAVEFHWADNEFDHGI
jgi:putative ABC transport system substrate-binding protein